MLIRTLHPHRHPGRTCFVSRLSGFTLIEVVGVLSIIAILAAVMIPAMMKSMQRTERQNEELNLETIAEGLEAYMLHADRKSVV